MKKILLPTLILALISTPVFADFLPPAFSSKFEQEYISTLKGKVKKGLGSIEYKYPGMIRFETTTPSTVIFVSNGVKAWYYRAPFIEGEQGEVTESSAKEGSTIYIKFFDSLKYGLTSNEYYEVKQGVPATLVFKANASKELGIKESRLHFKLKSQKFEDIEMIELTFADGKTSKIKFIDLKVNADLSTGRFNFVAPVNTKKTN
ncbi:MAG: outer membrane lipoprotein carrier protein LolA [Bacteriovorax sp.]|nr:outer membrane lipoprotein carrier protein LolA [Bacteriovorax sp.]